LVHPNSTLALARLLRPSTGLGFSEFMLAPGPGGQEVRAARPLRPRSMSTTRSRPSPAATASAASRRWSCSTTARWPKQQAGLVDINFLRGLVRRPRQQGM